MSDLHHVNRRLKNRLDRVRSIVTPVPGWFLFLLAAGSLVAGIDAAGVSPERTLAEGPLEPSAPLLVGPADQTPDVSSSPTLEVRVSDSDSDALTVTFFGREAPTAPGPDFTLIGIPDTQYYTSSWRGGSPAIFAWQTRWIADNVSALNVAYAVQLGDCVQNGDNDGKPTEWLHADAALRQLENTCTTGLPDGVPYGVCVGNHDQSPVGDADGTTVLYNQFFGIDRFQGRSYYGGHFGSDNDNWYELFSASGMDFIVIGLEYDTSPSPIVLNWASQLLTTYSNRRAIIASHSLIKPGNPGPFTAQGQVVYDALKGHSNLFLMLCGHHPGEGLRQDTAGGHTIHTVLADYQVRASGGNGWLRIMEFSPTNNVIRFRTYSPWLDKFETDTDSEFDLEYDMQSGWPFQVIAQMDVPSGSTASAAWPGLSPGTDYEWYATVSDGSSSITGPTWTFITSSLNEAPPEVAVFSPNGGEVLTGAIPSEIRWSLADRDGVTEVDLALSLNGGCTWSSIASGVPNTGAHQWTVPTTASTRARIRVTAHGGAASAGHDISDSDFEIHLVTSSTARPPAPVLAFHPPAPNPFSQRSTIAFTVPTTGRVRITIFDVTGRHIKTLVDGVHEPGRHSLTWNAHLADGRRASPGLYFLRLEAAGGEKTRKLILTP